MCSSMSDERNVRESGPSQADTIIDALAREIQVLKEENLKLTTQLSEEQQNVKRAQNHRHELELALSKYQPKIEKVGELEAQIKELTKRVNDLRREKLEEKQIVNAILSKKDQEINDLREHLRMLSTNQHGPNQAAKSPNTNSNISSEDAPIDVILKSIAKFMKDS